MLIWCLVWCLSCLHSYHIFSPLQNHVYVLLNTSLTNVSILARHKPLLSRFSGFSQYLSTHSPIHQAKFLNSLSARHIEVFLPLTPPRHLLIYWDFVLNTSSTPVQSIEKPVSIYTWGLTRFTSISNISILFSSLSIQTLSFLKNPSSLQDFSPFQSPICCYVL